MVVQTEQEELQRLFSVSWFGWPLDLDGTSKVKGNFPIASAGFS